MDVRDVGVASQCRASMSRPSRALGWPGARTPKAGRPAGMGSKKASRAAKGAAGGAGKVAAGAEIPVVGAREACPCGSGRRYKACHGREAHHAAPATQAEATGSRRPFEGLPGECDMVAMRELVPAATAPLKLASEHADRHVTLATAGDPDRDLADALSRALDSEPGTVLPSAAAAPDGPRLRDLLDTSAEGL